MLKTKFVERKALLFLFDAVRCETTQIFSVSNFHEKIKLRKNKENKITFLFLSVCLCFALCLHLIDSLGLLWPQLRRVSWHSIYSTSWGRLKKIFSFKSEENKKKRTCKNARNFLFEEIKIEMRAITFFSSHLIDWNKWDAFQNKFQQIICFHRHETNILLSIFKT